MPVEGCGGLCATRHCFLRSIMHVFSDVVVASILVVNFILLTLEDTLASVHASLGYCRCRALAAELWPISNSATSSFSQKIQEMEKGPAEYMTDPTRLSYVVLQTMPDNALAFACPPRPLLRLLLVSIILVRTLLKFVRTA